MKFSTTKLALPLPLNSPTRSVPNGPNPLWIITAALAVFFAVAAAFLAAS